MEEIWKDVKGYEGYYQVSTLGRIKSLSRHRKVGWADYTSKEKIIAQCNHRCGYKLVLLHKNGEKKMYKVHQLVATAFIFNPNNLPCVNHKDEDKTNNCVDNLEWCDHSYNNNYGSRNEKVRKANCKTVIQLSLDGKYIKEWNGMREAARSIGCVCSRISEVCRGKRRSHGGYLWKFKEQ